MLVYSNPYLEIITIFNYIITYLNILSLFLYFKYLFKYIIKNKNKNIYFNKVIRCWWQLIFNLHKINFDKCKVYKVTIGGLASNRKDGDLEKKQIINNQSIKTT